MATTSLWHIEGRLKDLIDYVENPEKTRAENQNLEALWDIFSYVQRPEATEQGEYVSAINCLKEIAFHLDKNHLHNHFCFNSVSFIDGGKYNYSKTEQRKLRNVSDRICREHGLSVIENPHKAPSRQIWLDEKSGKPTRYNVYREDVKESANFSRTPYYMEEYLQRKGYITDFTGKHWKIRLPQYEHFTRLDTLYERWMPENIQKDYGSVCKVRKPKSRDNISVSNAAGFESVVQAVSADKPYLQAVSALLLSARLSS